MSSSNSPALVGSSFVANELGCDPSTIRRLADRGLIPFVRDASGKRLFRSEHVEQLKQLLSKSPRTK